jgi:cytochrome P450
MHTTATLPPGPKARWITGHLSDFRAGPLEFLARCAREHGDFVPLRIGFRKVLLVSDPAAIEEVLLTKSRDFIKHFGLQMTRQLLGNGLLTSEGDFWLRQRRLAQPAFHRDRIHEYGRVMIDHTRQMLAGWRDGDRRDLVAEMMGLTLRIAAKTLFDADESGGDAAVVREQLGKSIRLFNARFSSLIRFPLGWPTPRNLKMRAVSQRLNEIIYKYIRRRREEGVTGRTDLLSLLLHARDVEGDGTGMTDAQLRDEVMTLFLAGQETTALALSWGWYLLCQHPAVEERLVAEVRDVLGDRPLTVDDVTVGGYPVAKGWTVFMSQSVVQRDPRWWDKPDEFRPERWLDGSTKNLPKYAYFPFGGGPRICIGNTFAMMETVIVLTEVARWFHFERTSNEPIPPLPSITVRPTKPLDVILHSR